MRSTGRAGSGAIVVSSAFGCVLRRRGERFELVIVDLPAFAKREDEVAGALQSYGRLTGLALGVLAPGGRLVMASCSSRVSAPDFFATAQAGRPLAEIDRTGHAIDHPIRFPEGAYLKCLFATAP
jgi:23S rRNA (cytosine1962-C5)-methyltransferase